MENVVCSDSIPHEIMVWSVLPNVEWPHGWGSMRQAMALIGKMIGSLWHANSLWSNIGCITVFHSVVMKLYNLMT